MVGEVVCVVVEIVCTLFVRWGKAWVSLVELVVGPEQVRHVGGDVGGHVTRQGRVVPIGDS